MKNAVRITNRAEQIRIILIKSIGARVRSIIYPEENSSRPVECPWSNSFRSFAIKKERACNEIDIIIRAFLSRYVRRERIDRSIDSDKMFARNEEVRNRAYREIYEREVRTISNIYITLNGDTILHYSNYICKFQVGS